MGQKRKNGRMISAPTTCAEKFDDANKKEVPYVFFVMLPQGAFGTEDRMKKNI